jgi:3D (Asp-Asp-Asp) domain-containing protein
MRYLLLFAILLSLPLHAQRWMRFFATAYSAEGETASGKQTREGRTVAADPKILPIGTRVEIDGAGPYSGVYTVQDSGRKIKGLELDIFIDDPAEARKFGRQPVRVRVVRNVLKQP